MNTPEQNLELLLSLMVDSQRQEYSELLQIHPMPDPKDRVRLATFILEGIDDLRDLQQGRAAGNA